MEYLLEEACTEWVAGACEKKVAGSYTRKNLAGRPSSKPSSVSWFGPTVSCLPASTLPHPIYSSPGCQGALSRTASEKLISRLKSFKGPPSLHHKVQIPYFGSQAPRLPLPARLAQVLRFRYTRSSAFHEPALPPGAAHCAPVALSSWGVLSPSASQQRLGKALPDISV